PTDTSPGVSVRVESRLHSYLPPTLPISGLLPLDIASHNLKTVECHTISDVSRRPHSHRLRHPLYLSMCHICTPSRGMVATVPSPSLPCFMTSRIGPTEYSACASERRCSSMTRRKLQAGFADPSEGRGTH